MSKNRICENCVYWQDYEERVWARLSVATEYPINRGLELRMCKYSPAPIVEHSNNPAYTDENFTCSEFKESTNT